MRLSSPWLVFCFLSSWSVPPCAYAFQVGRSAAGDTAVFKEPSVTIKKDGPETTLQTFRPDIPKMKPLSYEPLMLVSETPLLTAEECLLLRQKYQRSLSSSLSSTFNVTRANAVLKSLQQRLDCLILRENENVVQPRFLDYPADHNLDLSQPLLPDGLHVDTNNGFHFRYLTVLVYLSTSHKFGATTFPLAKPIQQHYWDEDLEQKPGSLQAAQVLLDANVYHTQVQSDSKTIQQCAEQLNRAAKDLFDQSQQSLDGIRVLPRLGHCTIFSSIDVDGRPDPRSWHGAEHVYVEPKQALSFFYEIPVHLIGSQDQFGREAHQRYNQLKERWQNTRMLDHLRVRL